MGPAVVMIVGTAAAWGAAIGIWGSGVGRDVGLGFLGPLLGALATRVLIVRSAGVAPERLTARMMGALAGKMVFFGAYIALAVRGLGVRPAAFVLSFTGAFLVLHGVEAMLLRRTLVRLPPGASATPRV